ncbi:serine/threonine-protein phosphatase [Candidatus Uhrbacteria bacterium]|nr:serine/threonine-protein phosphatase [Candidatus Uhrbacteria bacterium]
MPEVLSKKEYIEAKEREPSLVNVGEAPVTGIKHKGNPERKEICEDVKINDPDNGLFFVGDGVTTANGWFASRETARILNDSLGEKLDEQIERIAQNDKLNAKRKEELIDALVRSQIRAAILEADNSIRTKVKADPEMSASATTASLVKLVEMPDKTQDVFISNIGDSRIFIIRNGKLIRLTKDDSLLTYAVSEKIMSEEQARQIDQADSINDVADRWKSYYSQRNMVTNSVGGHGLEKVDVHRFHVQPGDKIIIASDGLTDQLKEIEIEEILRKFSDPREAEKVLQKSAEKMSLDGTLPRAKGDDIAVVVHEIGERGHDRVRREESAEPENITQERVSSWRVQAARLQSEIREKRERLQGVDAGTKEGLEQLITLRQKEQDLSVYDYWIARASILEFEKNLPARFDKGQSVQVFRTDLEPPSYDRQLWKVSSYDEKNDYYILDHPNGTQHRFVERYTLELWQKESLVQPADVVNGYRVEGKDDKDQVVLTKKLPDSITRRVETEQTVDKLLRDELKKAQAAKKGMESARERANVLQSEIQNLTERRVKLLAK